MKPIDPETRLARAKPIRVNVGDPEDDEGLPRRKTGIRLNVPLAIVIAGVMVSIAVLIPFGIGEWRRLQIKRSLEAEKSRIQDETKALRDKIDAQRRP